MDTWSIIALCLVVPALLFLVTAAVVSALRMPHNVIRPLLLTGMALLPLAVACVWLRDQPWMTTPWDAAVDLAGTLTGFIVAYALIVGLTIAIRYVGRLIPGCALSGEAHDGK